MAQVNPQPGIKCLSPDEVDRIAGGLKDLALCKIALSEKEKLIQERLVAPADAPQTAWWQEPGFVWGGILISASVASLATFFVVQKSK